MSDEAQERREEELAQRDRIGEKSPAADAAFGAHVILEHKDGSHIPPEVAERQRETYERLLDGAISAPAPDPYTVEPSKVDLLGRLRWVFGLRR
jgi:hypothetical protein